MQQHARSQYYYKGLCYYEDEFHENPVGHVVARVNFKPEKKNMNLPPFESRAHAAAHVRIYLHFKPEAFVHC